jgi:hypothetical protein
VASLLRGSRYVHDEQGGPVEDSAVEDSAVEDSAVEDSRVDASRVDASRVDASTAYAEVSSGDDLEGVQGGVGRVGDPAAADGDLAQRR